MLTRQLNQKLAEKEQLLVPVNTSGDIRCVVAYPNRYWVAMSNLGFQTVYRLFAAHPRFAVERAYLPENQKEAVTTFENNRPISSAEILAVSVSFETDYPHVVRLLESAGVRLDDCRERTRRGFGKDAPSFRPLVIAGGAALTLNPEPLANLIDVIAVGEGEGMIEEISATYIAARDEGCSFDELLTRLSLIEGIYVPSLYSPRYGADDSIAAIDVAPGAPARPLRRYVKDIDSAPTFTVIKTPETEFKAMFMTETGRGCEVGCRFCVAGYMYRPVRKRSQEAIAETVQLGMESSESIGFVGASVSSHPKIAELASGVAAAGKRAALSSIMSQRVTKELASSLSESEYKTVALAPEAGSEELRFRIGKRVVDEQILSGIATLAESGVRNFKLYFIVGLPSETLDDVRAIVSLIERACERALAAARAQQEFKIAPKLILSVNPFIPKAWTPFQRHPFLGAKEIKERLEIVRRGVQRLANVEMKAEAPKESYFQTLMSRGDRRVGDLLIELHKRGEEWKWLVAKGTERILPEVPPTEFYVRRQLGADELLPWEVVDLRLKRSLLEREYARTFDEPVEPLIARAKRLLAAESAAGTSPLLPRCEDLARDPELGSGTESLGTEFLSI